MADSTVPKAHLAVTGDVSEMEKGTSKIPEISSPNGSDTVTWENDSDPENPYNWSNPRKWFTTLLTSVGGLVTLMSGAMLAPALSVMSEDLNISEAEASMALSIYILAFVFGPMVLAPSSEVWGRRPIWIVGGMWYTLWNALCGVSKNRGLLLTGRLMAGLGASAEFAVSGPITADIWSADDRGKSMAIRSVLPLLGPALGPIVGGAMVQTVSWRWLFYVLSIFNGLVVLLFIVALPETHTPTLLRRKAARLRKSTGTSYYAAPESGAPALFDRLKIALLRPTRMLLTQPILQLTSLYMACQFGMLYIALASISSLWTDEYNQSAMASGLHYLAIVTGYMVALSLQGWAMDRIWARLKTKNGGKTSPEHRLPLLMPAVLLVPIGLLWYGWAAERHLHWIVTDIGIAVFGCGYIIGVTASQAYVIEAFIDHTASAGAASQLPRNVFAFVFPIFAPSLYDSLGYGQGNTVLAAISVGIGLPTPWILWHYGEKLRKKGRAVE